MILIVKLSTNLKGTSRKSVGGGTGYNGDGEEHDLKLHSEVLLKAIGGGGLTENTPAEGTGSQMPFEFQNILMVISHVAWNLIFFANIE